MSDLFLPQEDQGHVVHDMKSPFNGLVGLTEAMAQIAKDPARKAQFLIVNKAAKRCCDRIEQQVSCDKLASGLVDFTASDVDLSALVMEAVAVLSLARDVHGNSVKVDKVELIAPNLPQTAVIKASEWHVFKIVYEVIFNAIKFTNSGKVEVTIDEISDSFVLSIFDTGPGFPPSVLQSLGRPFNRKISDFRLEMFREALGLGLAFSKEVLNFQGGDLVVSSNSPTGCVVKCTFPKSFRVQEVFTSGGPEGFGYLTSLVPEISKSVAQRRALGLIAHTLLPVHFGLLGIGVQLLAGETKPGPKNQVAVLETCAKRVIEVMTLIRDACFLEESEIQGSVDCDVISIVDRCVQELHVALDKRGVPMKTQTVNFTFKKQNENIKIFQDPARLYRALYQLMDNANKFTKEGSIEVSCERLEDGNISIKIQDTGVGFASSDSATISQLFVPFHRLNGDGFYGLGIGLNMVKAFCDKAGIDLSFSSAKGQGTTVTLTVPDLPARPEVSSDLSVQVEVERKEKPAMTVMPELIAKAFESNISSNISQQPALVEIPLPDTQPITTPPQPQREEVSSGRQAEAVSVEPVNAVVVEEEAEAPALPVSLQERTFGLFYDGADVVTASLYERCGALREDLARLYELRRKSKELLVLIDMIDDSTL